MKNDSHVLVVFIDDNGEIVQHWVELLEQTVSTIKFRNTKGDIITIPIHRMLKMKERGEGSE